MDAWCCEEVRFLENSCSHPTTFSLCCIHTNLLASGIRFQNCPGLCPAPPPTRISHQNGSTTDLTGRPPFSYELLALPARLGGMGVFNPIKTSPLEYQASLKVTLPLTNAILKRSENYSYDIWSEQLSANAGADLGFEEGQFYFQNIKPHPH